MKQTRPLTPTVANEQMLRGKEQEEISRTEIPKRGQSPEVSGEWCSRQWNSPCKGLSKHGWNPKV
jgi:hypothetical protein